MLTVLARAEGGRFERCPPEELPRLLRTPESFVWVDLEAPAADEVAVLSDVFHFHPLTIDDCLNQYVDPPKADDYGHYLFLVVQGIAFSHETVLQPESVETTELNVYLGRSYVVSFHQRPLPSVSEARGRCERSAPLPARGPDWLTHALLDTLVDQLLPAVEAMDERIAELQDQAIESPDRALMERLVGLKRCTLRLRRLMTPQRDVINRLARGDFPALVSQESHIHFRDIYDHMVRLESMVEGLRDLNDGAISTYLATINNRLTEITKALSVAGTVFLPLTLVASIFGTNFSPTYEAWGWTGFLGMCAFMLLMMVALAAWFRHRGWL
jgi:magnesium transporter